MTTDQAKHIATTWRTTHYSDDVTADALEAQAAEIERLRDALRYCAYPEALHPANQACYLVARAALEK